MKKFNWYFNRLRAMSFPELFWRISQKAKHSNEKKKYKNKSISVIELTVKEFKKCQCDFSKIKLKSDNSNYTIGSTISLFHMYDYEKYKKQWNAGFQTDNTWASDFTYDIDVQQREDIGDIRTNWELNRHFQFTKLSKSYYITNDEKYLNELDDLFHDWNCQNPFLHGISWSSPMEMAIRIYSWAYTGAFLNQSRSDRLDGKADSGVICKIKKLELELANGIAAMAAYIKKHYSRYSSANNHTIIEASALLMVGIIYGNKKFEKLGVQILSFELESQVYHDGVDKELSLHYHAFVMEAMGLVTFIMIKNQIVIPLKWLSILESMSQYLSDCIGKYGETIEFGDNDEGRILELTTNTENYYEYVLQLMSCILKHRFSEFTQVYEEIGWIWGEENLESVKRKNRYDNTVSKAYTLGGYSILKSADQEIIIGIDHGPLGYGTLAAHGHADALSFQMYAYGYPVFMDPGTYNYHYKKRDRDIFRSTHLHNTATIQGKNQSVMLGAFLWGKRANCILKEINFNDSSDVIIAEHDGYKPITHQRMFGFNKKNILYIKDIFGHIQGETEITNTLLLAPNLQIYAKSDRYYIGNKNLDLEISFHSNCDYQSNIQEVFISPYYNNKVKTCCININMCSTQDMEFEIYITNCNG